MNLKEFAKHVWPAIKIRIYNEYSKGRSDRYEELAGDIVKDDDDVYSRLFVINYIIWEDHIDVFV